MPEWVKWLLALVVTLIVMVLGLAVTAWWWTGPMRYAGPSDVTPRNLGEFAVPADHGQPARVEVYRLLNEERFDDLTRLVESKTSLANKDTRNESELGRVMDAFSIADPAMAALFDRWVAANPRSFAPYLARSVQSYALAYLERGTDVAARTSDAQVAGMMRHLERVAEDAIAALEINSQLAEAYKVLIDVARVEGNQRRCGLFAARGLEIAPASFRVRAALAICRLPRWGGSHEQVRSITRLAGRFVPENPDLLALNGFVAWDQGRIAEGEQALAYFDEALKAGTYWRFYFERAREHLRADQFDRALADTTEALRLNPQEPDVLLLHVDALARLGRLREASPQLEILKEINAASPDLQAFLKNAAGNSTYDGYQMQQRGDLGGAVKQLTQAIQTSGGDAESYYWRARAHLKSGNNEAALADFLEATRLAPDHFESYRNIDYIYASKGEWPPIIEQWNRYLAYAPDDPRAWFERSGTYFNMGNQQAAKADMRKACELGSPDACGQMKRLGWD